MKIVFADSFFESLKRPSIRRPWWYVVYEVFRYNIPWFFRNIIAFRRELYKFRTWDSAYNLGLLRRSLELTCDNIEKNGMEIEESRNKKVLKMRRAIEILTAFERDSFIELAEKELGYDVNTEDVFSPASEADRAIFNKCREMEAEWWKELWEIIHGTITEPGHNGTDMRGWWD